MLIKAFFVVVVVVVFAKWRLAPSHLGDHIFERSLSLYSTVSGVLDLFINV